MLHNIFLTIALVLFGAVIGGGIMLAYLNKSVEDLCKSTGRVIECYKNIQYLDQKIIEGKDEIIHNTYLYLVNLRDNNEGTLDEIIGVLGEYLDDHAEEESPCNSDQ